MKGSGFEPHQYLITGMWKRLAQQPCCLRRGQQVSHKRWISGNVLHVHLFQEWIRLRTLSLKPKGDVTRSPKEVLEKLFKKCITLNCYVTVIVTMWRYWDTRGSCSVCSFSNKLSCIVKNKKNMNVCFKSKFLWCKISLSTGDSTLWHLLSELFQISIFKSAINHFKATHFSR